MVEVETVICPALYWAKVLACLSVASLAFWEMDRMLGGDAP